MKNPVKMLIRRYVERTVGDINQAAEARQSYINDRLMQLEKAITDTQLKINHNQLEVLDEIGRKVKNSGVIWLNETEIVAKIFSGLKFYLDPRDIAVVPHLVLDSIWEHRITAAWLHLVGKNDVIVDVGANFGYFAALAAQLTDKKKSKVISFEANPKLIPYIEKTLAVNWLKEQSIIENLALADKKGLVTLNVLKDYIGSSSIHDADQLDKYMHGKMNIEVQERFDVPAVTLDEYCVEHGITAIDLIKMDIEGFEDKAYHGMRKIVKNSPNLTLFVEFTQDAYEDPRAFYEQMLEDFGTVYVIDNDGYITKPEANGYDAVIGDADDWVMPIFSKRSDLANR